MKINKLYIVTTFIAAVICCTPTPGYSSDNNSDNSDNNTVPRKLNYTAAFIMQWTYNCVQQLQFTFMNDGIPQQYAAIRAGSHCTCVIDEFRKYYTQVEIGMMSSEDRLLFSEHFARTCLGQPSNFN